LLTGRHQSFFFIKAKPPLLVLFTFIHFIFIIHVSKIMLVKKPFYDFTHILYTHVYFWCDFDRASSL